jgi:hypothetical protein
MEERKKTKGPEEDSQNRLRPPMSDGGEQENLALAYFDYTF